MSDKVVLSTEKALKSQKVEAPRVAFLPGGLHRPRFSKFSENQDSLLVLSETLGNHGDNSFRRGLSGQFLLKNHCAARSRLEPRTVTVLKAATLLPQQWPVSPKAGASAVRIQ